MNTGWPSTAKSPFSSARTMASLMCSSIASWCADMPRASRAACRSTPDFSCCASAMRHRLVELLRLLGGGVQLQQLLGIVRGTLLVAEGALVVHAQQQHIGTRGWHQ